MTGAQFKQNHPKFVKPTLRCDTAGTVGYSEWCAICKAIYLHP